MLYRILPRSVLGRIDITNGNTVIFKPGLYYIQGNRGFTLKKVRWGRRIDGKLRCDVRWLQSRPNTGAGMVVFDTGPAGSTLGNNPSGGFTIDTKVQITLKGSTLVTTNSKGKTVAAGPYYGMLFFEDRTANAHTGNNGHTFGKGNGCFSLIGNIYATNPMAVMSDPNHYQQVTYNGTPCSATVQKGNIIVGALELKGDSAIYNEPGTKFLPVCPQSRVGPMIPVNSQGAKLEHMSTHVHTLDWQHGITH